MDYLHCFLPLAGHLQMCFSWSAWVTAIGTRCSPCQGGAGASGWVLVQWVWWQRCRSGLVGCLWTVGWVGCVPAGSGCAPVGHFKTQLREKGLQLNGRVQKSNQSRAVVSKTTYQTWLLRQTYLLEQGELSLMAMKTLEELTFLNWACSQG